MTSRFALAAAAGAVSLPGTGQVLCLRPPVGMDLGTLSMDRVQVDHGVKPDLDWWLTNGAKMSGNSEAALVCIARARALTFDLLAQAIAAVPTGAPVIVDGAKADGIEGVLKACRAIVPVGEVFSKAHGKCFAFPAPAHIPEGWADTPRLVDGFQTRAGVFSADGVDPGSGLLADHLDSLSGTVCDLGGGWGYLSARALASKDITTLDLVEVEARAIQCAQANLRDPRAKLHWADATTWQGGPYDWVISNPPFHTGRATDPGLGQAFIASAARILAPNGRLRMVANRHLPYEATLADQFATVMVLADTQGYKVIDARKPRPKGIP